MSTRVDVGKRVSRATLEKALGTAAEKLGWKIDSKKEYEKKYTLGSVRETQRHSWTDFNLKKRFFNRMQVTTFPQTTIDYFLISPYATSKKDVEEYLSAVSDNLRD
ncbi:MAG TPA: hypothetical protein ENG87_00875 [Candidatus Pacearchaeota archaeon]|nr:hypothetical protein BMS3Abin17_01257 [archaeon BMS3Abin17]HDK41903.1 hypothetical protein [Candidatus Pacearchaeota archaeon]HDZ60592.1 hypothetical protein [Candidatus Pacearchaeota archaeon]